MGLSQASWLVSCVSGMHRCPTLSMLPCHPMFFFNDTSTAENFALPLHDALPICLHSHTTSSPHIVSPYIVMLYLMFVCYLHLDYYNVIVIVYCTCLKLIDGVIARVRHPMSWA